MLKKIIFTDLDGTLLDARTYAFDKAMPALQRARQLDIPVIFVSSKTRAELEVWRNRLENRRPFISENGGGIFIPDGYFPFPVEGEPREGFRIISLGMPYAEIRGRFMKLRERLGIAVRGFGDMTPDQIAELTGLPIDDAVLAGQREFGEPFLFPGPSDERFLRAIEADGLRWTQGRFFYIMGDHDKGKAVTILRQLFERMSGPVMSIGIGDSLNDLPFLLAVDHPVLVRKENDTRDSRVDIPGLVRTNGIGSAGWNEAMSRLLAE